jgi:hypothetical protein
LLALLLLGLFLFRRRKFHKTQKERPVDLLQEGDDEEDGDNARGRDDLPQYYRPDPFTLPDPTVAASSVHGGSDAGDADHLLGAGAAAAGAAGVAGSASRPSTSENRHSFLRPGTPSDRATSTGTRKTTAGPTPLRPVNIIQHEDGHRVEDFPAPGEDETIELPPAYTNIKRDPSRRVPKNAEAGSSAEASGSGTTTTTADEGSPSPSAPVA